MGNASISLARVGAIIRKELLVLLGNRVSRMMLIVPPFLQIIFFGWAATMEVRNVRVAYINHDAGKWSREILHRIEGAPTFTHVFAIDGEGELKKTLDEQAALFVLVFNQEFSRNIARGEPAEAQIILDGRRANAAQIAAAYVSQIIQDVSQTLGGKGTASMPILDIRPRCWFNPNLDFQWYFLPNLIGILSLMLGLIITGLSVAREREVGTFDQLLVSPATPTEIALAKLAPGVLAGLVHGTLFILIAIFGFLVPLNGSLALLYIAIFVFAIACGGIGLMVSSIASTQQQAFLGVFTIGVPCVLISGAITPLINMPPFLRHLSQINPMRHFTVISQGVFLKDITWGAAMLNLGKIALIGVVTVGFAVWMFRRRG